MNERLRAAFPTSILEERPPEEPHSGMWVIDLNALPNIASYLSQEPELRFSQLLHYGLYEQYRRLVGTLHLGSELHDLVVRIRFQTPSIEPFRRVLIPSVAPVWVRAFLYEEELADLLGVDFSGGEPAGRFYVSAENRDFPLRKRHESGTA